MNRSCLLLCLLTVTVWIQYTPVCLGEKPTARPNVIIVLADDLGWSELACYGNTFHETPHLNRLATDGVRFTSAYAPAPVCSPYRAALLTGQHPARVGITDYLRPNSANGLSTQQVTLAQRFRDHGYRTGMIGKWHLSGYAYHGAPNPTRPTDHGFDWNLASEVKGVGNGANFWPYVFRDQPIRWLDVDENRLGESEFLVDRMNFEAVEFIKRNHHQPFFLLLSHYAPHSIVNGKPGLVEKYRKKHPPGESSRQRCYLCQDQGLQGDPLNHWAKDHNPHLAAMIESIDDGVGLIMKQLEESGIADNTIILFTSDNGGETNVTTNAPLRGGKSELYEGGIRVPMIVRWPQRIPSGVVCDHPTTNLDLYPTLLEATGMQVEPTHTLDGQSTLTSWKAPTTSTPPREFYWHYPLDRPHFLGGISGAAIRAGNWKLIERFDGAPPQLFAIDSDPSETNNVADKHPAVVKRLQQNLTSWQAETGAIAPSPPQLVQKRQLLFADHFASGQANERWFFSEHWSVESDHLVRGAGDNQSRRIFLRDTKLRDAIIRFSFRFDTSKNIRFLTGASGPYNTVLHIHPDHFYLQTAKDESGPTGGAGPNASDRYFSFRHSECAFDFQPGTWYSMTVEFVEDRCIAHLDPDHVVVAHHPIINKQRTYFAFQVDEGTASFDDVQIFSVAKNRDFEEALTKVHQLENRFPVAKSIAEAYQIQLTNAHDWFYQRDAKYRGLVRRVEQWDDEKKRRYPEIFRTQKEEQKAIHKVREERLKNDADFKELLFATYRAKRAIEAFLVEQSPQVAELPESRRKREIELLRRKHSASNQYMRLVEASNAAQSRLEKAYPEVFVDLDELRRRKAQLREQEKDSPAFQKLMQQRADAYQAQQDYLFTNDSKLAELKSKLGAQ